MSTQGLSTQKPIEGGVCITASNTPAGARSAELTVAGVVPTIEEITTGLEAAFDEDDLPAIGETVGLTVGGTLKLRAKIVTELTGAGGLWENTFEIPIEGEDPITYYAELTQTGIY